MNDKLTTGKIRRELAILIEEKKKSCTTEAEVNHAINQARREINTKYGKDWREKYPTAGGGYDFSKPSCAQGLGDEWDHYPWSADDY